MRETRSILSPILLLCLLTWRCCDAAEAGSYDTGVAFGAGGRRCTSQYVTVADTTSFPIAGCYRKTMNPDHGSDFSFANYEGKVVEGMSSQPMVMRKWDVGTEESPWGIGVDGEPPSAMCISGDGTRTGGWKCTDGATFEELVTCGCSTSEQEASERHHAAWVDAQRGSIDKRGVIVWGSSSSSSTGRRNSMRGADSRDKRLPRVAGASGGAGVSRVLSNGEFHSFWMWVIIAGGITGLIILCCIGWYIRNPFFCQKPPPADPNVQAEDAAPQAPKTAFQPWGASAPPK